MDYVVTAGYVTVETAVSGGRAQVDIACGETLPGDVPVEQREELLRLDRIAAVEVAETETPGERTEPGQPPPRRGPGSGVDAWTAYAHSWGVAVPDGHGRDQIRDMLAEQGIPV